MSFKWLSFLIDVPSFIVWCQANIENFAGLVSARNYFKIFVSGSYDKAALKTEIEGYLAGLTSGGEATKRALPSRKISTAAQKTFEAAVKAHIATKTWDSMSAAERTFAMGGSLSPSDYDTLTTS